MTEMHAEGRKYQSLANQVRLRVTDPENIETRSICMGTRFLTWTTGYPEEATSD